MTKYRTQRSRSSSFTCSKTRTNRSSASFSRKYQRESFSFISSPLHMQSDFPSSIIYPLYSDMWLCLIGTGSTFIEVTMDKLDELNIYFVLFFLHFHYRQVRLDPTAVKNDMELLKRFCTEGEKRVLKSVRYTSGSNYLHISLGCKELLLTLMQCTGKQREKKKLVFCCNKRHESHYICQFPVISLHVFYCLITMYLSCLSKAASSMCTSGEECSLCPLFLRLNRQHQI